MSGSKHKVSTFRAAFAAAAVLLGMFAHCALTPPDLPLAYEMAPVSGDRPAALLLVAPGLRAAREQSPDAYIPVRADNPVRFEWNATTGELSYSLRDGDEREIR